MRNRLVLTFSILVFFAAAAPVRAAVVINELYPKYTDPAWEFVELYNTGDQSVSLDRWKLDHTGGDAKSFTLNASAIIEPHGFLVYYGSQSQITFSVNGDTARLFDAGGALVDSKSYPATLGYNTAMGRPTDGGDGWVVCAPDPTYSATPGKPNKCPPAPTSTPVPPPTSTLPPTPTALPPTPANTPAQQSFATLLASPTSAPPAVLGTTTQPSPTAAPLPTPTPADVLQLTVSKLSIAYVAVGIAVMGIFVMAISWLRRIRKSP